MYERELKGRKMSLRNFSSSGSKMLLIISHLLSCARMRGFHSIVKSDINFFPKL